MSQQYDVVWTGRDPLLPAEGRDEHWDTRFAGMPSHDLDEMEIGEIKPNRKYTKTGKYKGVFSRTNPAAAQYLPTDTPGGGTR